MASTRKLLAIPISLTVTITISLAIYFIKCNFNVVHSQPNVKITNDFRSAVEFTNCLAPNVDSWDPVYKKFFRTRTYTCEYEKPLTTISDDGLITLTNEGRDSTISCFASTIVTKPLNDDKLIYGDHRQLTADRGLQLTNEKDVANVTCYKSGLQHAAKNSIYVNTHLYIPDFNATANKDRPSVVVFFLESLSTGSFRRFMPKTQEALRTIGHFQELEGFVKPVDNSFPYSMAIITGKIVGGHKQFLAEAKKKYFDGSAPFVWEDFKKNGYVTAFLEDMALVGLFNYHSNGFAKSPVDWMPKSYWLQMYTDMNFDWEICRNTKYYCFEKNGAKLELFLNQTRDFIKKMTIRKQPFFFWPFFSQMTHTNFDDFQMVDEEMAKFFMDIASYLKNTVMIFAGDHGPRVNDFPMTMMGRLEERMTYVTIRIPPELDAKYPHFRTNLELNRKRLTSMLDVHKMLKDISGEQFDEVLEPSTTGPINLMREVAPLNRSCKDAMIQHEYCVCNGRINLYTGTKFQLGVPKPKMIIDYVNQLIYRTRNCHLTLIPKKLEKMHYVMNDDNSFMVEELKMTISLNNSDKWVAKTLWRDHNRGEEFYVLKNREEDVKIVEMFCG